MAKVVEIASDRGKLRKFPLRVAAYCRVSTESEEQGSSLELQTQHFIEMIDGHPGWENAGVFAEKESGLRLKARSEFHALMRLCKKGKVDLILTKSISRFGRDTLASLQSMQNLRSCGVDVLFENEGIWLHDHRLDIIIATCAAFAQEESRNMSDNIKWGIKRGFESGTSGYAERVCFGYKRGDDGQLMIDGSDARIVQRIFEMRSDGCNLGEISDWLYDCGIFSPTGHERWSRETINKLLKNEKYIGDVMLQKTFVKDFLSGKQVINRGEMERYMIAAHHPAIVSRELFERVNGPVEYLI